MAGSGSYPVTKTKISPLLVMGLALLVLAGWGLYSSIEVYYENERSGWSRDALRP